MPRTKNAHKLSRVAAYLVRYLALSLLIPAANADQYDDAVIAAQAVPIIEKSKETDIPSYQETLEYITKNIKYPFTETAHCKFQYKENEGDMLTISDFNASELLAKTNGSLSLECQKMRKCILQDYWGFGNKSMYKHHMSFMGVYIFENNEQNRERLAESFNHLIVLCGGSREYE